MYHTAVVLAEKCWQVQNQHLLTVPLSSKGPCAKGLVLTVALLSRGVIGGVSPNGTEGPGYLLLSVFTSCSWGEWFCSTVHSCHKLLPYQFAHSTGSAIHGLETNSKSVSQNKPLLFISYYFRHFIIVTDTWLTQHNAFMWNLGNNSLFAENHYNQRIWCGK
jgi:hypothetical protein